jgi:hypothetical protein
MKQLWRYLLPTLGLLLISVAMAVSALPEAASISALSPTATPAPPTPAPTPTRGPAPTLAPPDLEGGTFIRDRQTAIQLALEVDARLAVREQPITLDLIAAHPEMISAKRYATQMETDFGVDTALWDEAVWVVTIKAKGTFSLPGIGRSGPMETDSVSYELLEKTGRMMGVALDPVKP